MPKKTSPSYLAHELPDGKVVNVPANRAARRKWAHENHQPVPRPLRMPFTYKKN